MRFCHIGDVRPSAARDLHADLCYNNSLHLHVSVTCARIPKEESLHSFYEALCFRILPYKTWSVGFNIHTFDVCTGRNFRILFDPAQRQFGTTRFELDYLLFATRPGPARPDPTRTRVLFVLPGHRILGNV